MQNQFGSIVIRNERQFKAITGLTFEEFDKMVPVFAEELEKQKKEDYKKNRKNRKRRPGGGRKGVLSTPELQLFFILFYLKNYPTFDLLAAIFNISLSNAQENVKKLLPILIRTEKRLNVLPHRHFNPKFEGEEKLPEEQEKSEEIQRIDIDATERRCQRPKHQRKQKNYYSGKKKAHTFKNTVISDRDQTGILVVGPTNPGRKHDYHLLKQELDPGKDLSRVDASTDLGYQGIEKDYPNFHAIHIPHKKPRKSKNQPNPELTAEQKKHNRSVSQLRIGVEHVIGDMKSFHILSDRFRNRAIQLADQAILAVAGLCNLKNNYVVQ
jgi:hypothetical protein